MVNATSTWDRRVGKGKSGLTSGRLLWDRVGVAISIDGESSVQPCFNRAFAQLGSYLQVEEVSSMVQDTLIG